jgi:hypothetical protein
LLYHLGDPDKLASAEAVVRLICSAGLAAAVNLQRSAEGLRSIGMVRSAELAAEWLAQLPRRRSPAFPGLPDDLVIAMLADGGAWAEVVRLLTANRAVSQEATELLGRCPEDFGRALAPGLRAARALAREREPALRQAVKDALAELESAARCLQDDRGAPG